LAYQDSLPEDEYQSGQLALLDILHQVCRDQASLFYNHKNRYRDKQIVSPLFWLQHSPFKIRQEIIWSRPGSVTQNARMFLPCDERIFWLYKGDGFQFNDTTEIKSLSSIWKIGNEANKSHAVAFPIELPSRCIRSVTCPGELVIDPFLGSGTTMLAAEQLNRRCFGMEISPAYCAVILQRMTDAGCECELVEESVTA
jgi:modification methylase